MSQICHLGLGSYCMSKMGNILCVFDKYFDKRKTGTERPILRMLPCMFT